MADTRKDVLKTQFADQAYKDWLSKHNISESNDYNTRAAFDAGVKPDERGHLDDTYKNDNHVTYSKDSLRSKEPGAPPAGEWSGSDKGGWTFKASPTNVTNAGGAAALRQYFDKVEPESILELPQ